MATATSVNTRRGTARTTKSRIKKVIEEEREGRDNGAKRARTRTTGGVSARSMGHSRNGSPRAKSEVSDANTKGAQTTETPREVNFETAHTRDAEQAVDYTPHQFKAIKNKYLRHDHDMHTWLDRVAGAVALGSILGNPQHRKEKILKGLNVTVERPRGKGLAELVLIHDGLDTHDERMDNFYAVRERLQKFVAKDAAAHAEWDQRRKDYYSIMSSWEFLPNSPTLMNAGRALGQLSACYVLPIEDSIEGWFRTQLHAAIIHQSGGGTGFSGARVRPHGSEVRTTKGIASGPMSPLKIIDAGTAQIKQGGTRRGANMYILPSSHPNVMEFITSKRELDDKNQAALDQLVGFLGRIPGMEPGNTLYDLTVEGMRRFHRDRQIENFNISVGTDTKFWEAVRNDGEYELVDPHTHKVTKKVRARDMFQEMVKGAHATGDPGYVVLDRINNSNSNTTPHIGLIEATNPCGEQPLLPYEPCNLGSINLAQFVKGKRKTIDWTRLREVTRIATRFLDDVIDANNYPLPEIERMAKGNRRIGLGVMGWADALIDLGIPYDSEQAINLGEKVMKVINDESRAESTRLAAERGMFPHWTGSTLDPKSAHYRGKELRVRNCARTTIAPTGTISNAAGCSSGIEPLFALAYKRLQAEAVDAVQRGEEPDPQFVYVVWDSQFEAVAKKHEYFGLDKKELEQRVIAAGSIQDIAEIPLAIRRRFLTAQDIGHREHIDHQVAFQRHTDNAVSKTINMPKGATVEDVADAYLYGFDQGVKGLTVYRDQSKFAQVLNIGGVGGNSAGVSQEYDLQEEGAPGRCWVIPTGAGQVYLTCSLNPNGTLRPFVAVKPEGSEAWALAHVLGIAMSKAFEHGYDPRRMIKHLISIKTNTPPTGFGGKRIESIPHAIGTYMKKGLARLGLAPAEAGSEDKSNGNAVFAELGGALEQALGGVEIAGEKVSVPNGLPASLYGAPRATLGIVGSDTCPECYAALQHGEGCSKCSAGCGYSTCC